MDINSTINWSPGMELTARTFIGMEQQLDLRQQTALRLALGNDQMGLLPGTEYSCKGVFAGSTFEIERLQCAAVLPSGRIANADERVAVPIPMLFGDTYYLTMTIGQSSTPFERDGVAYLRPNYIYAIQTLEEMEASDVMPLVRFKVREGVFAVDADFIQPCLMLSGDERFARYIDRFAKALETLATHPNMAEGDGKRTIYRYLFLMKGYNSQHRVSQLVQLTQEIVQAIDYFIVAPNQPERKHIPWPHRGDVQLWLGWVEDYLSAAATILDKVVLEDNAIDYEALLAQAKRELYEQLHPELLQKLVAQTREELQQQMQQLTDSLTTYVRDTLKDELSRQLADDIETRSTQISDRLARDIEQTAQRMEKSLYDKLFSDVYIGVYTVLHEENEDHFIPLI